MLLGREAELRLVAERLRCKEPVAVAGDAGLGKTALVREAAAHSGCALLEAGALATLSWMPYLPLRRALGTMPGGDPENVASLVERAVGDGALFLDDIHWADAETRRLLPLLSGRIGLVAALRQGDQATGESLAELESEGFSILELEPLEDDAAAELVCRLRPELPWPEVLRIVGRAEGNPFLLEELAAHGESTEGIRRVLSARLRNLSATGREAMGLLSVARRPLAVELLGEACDELGRAGLVTVGGGVAAVRHDLLAEAAAAAVPDAERAALHLRLARLLDDPGEAARHYLSAGEQEAAYACAMQAARTTERPGEQAAHLALAAGCVEGSDAARLCLRAAAALSNANDHDAVESLLERVRTGDPAHDLEVWLLRYAAREARGDGDGARAALSAARALSASPERDIRLVLGEAHAALFLDGDPDGAVREAEDAARRAPSVGQCETDALLMVGMTRMYACAHGWEGPLRKAIERARSEEAYRTESRAASILVLGLLLAGRPGEARRLAEDGVARAGALGFARWERQFRRWIVTLDWHLGDLPSAAEGAGGLLLEIMDPSDRRAAQLMAAQVFVDVGRYSDAFTLARRVVDETSERTPGFLEEAIEARWAAGDVHLWSGSPAEALATSGQCLELMGGADWAGLAAATSVTRAWARFDLGLEPEGAQIEAAWPIVSAVPVELEALAALAHGRELPACDLFDRAGDLWDGRHFRGLLRCRWAAGEALRRAGRNAGAVERLEMAEQIATEHGHVALLARIQRSLRLAGARRSAGRAHVDGALTARELEILVLVGQGLSNAEIARQLGVGRPTVARLVSSASAKLGARTRRQAAVLASAR